MKLKLLLLILISKVVGVPREDKILQRYERGQSKILKNREIVENTLQKLNHEAFERQSSPAIRKKHQLITLRKPVIHIILSNIRIVMMRFFG